LKGDRTLFHITLPQQDKCRIRSFLKKPDGSVSEEKKEEGVGGALEGMVIWGTYHIPSVSPWKEEKMGQSPITPRRRGGVKDRKGAKRYKKLRRNTCRRGGRTHLFCERASGVEGKILIASDVCLPASRDWKREERL